MKRGGTFLTGMADISSKATGQNLADDHFVGEKET